MHIRPVSHANAEVPEEKYFSKGVKRKLAWHVLFSLLDRRGLSGNWVQLNSANSTIFK